MKNYILAILLAAFTFIIVHDFVITVEDTDTQTELILKDSGQIDSTQMCNVTQVHDFLHEMIVAPDILSDFSLSLVIAEDNKIFLDSKLYKDFLPSSLYKPPIYS
ncbi:MAG: hypothetical protein GXO31_07000 [Epsilonproteobacteria bacterium]|nr:hypothetical protein [Campylobacterota bacterium]